MSLDRVSREGEGERALERSEERTFEAEEEEEEAEGLPTLRLRASESLGA